MEMICYGVKETVFFSFDVVRDSLRLECQVVFDEGERLLTDLKG